jgi:hypothetical protein
MAAVVGKTSSAKSNKALFKPTIIEVEQEHAWCYVLVNSVAKFVGDLNIVSCVPKE